MSAAEAPRPPVAADRPLLLIHASADVGGTELQMIPLIELLTSSGIPVASLFDCPDGPMIARHRAARIPTFHAAPGPLGTMRALAWIARQNPAAAYVFGLKVGLKWRLLLAARFPGISQWGAIRGLSNTPTIGAFRRSAMMLNRATMGLVRGYVANSRFVRNHLAVAGFPPDKLHVLPNLANVTPIPREVSPMVVEGLNGVRWTLPDSVPTVLCVANVRPVKAHHLLLRAAAELVRRGHRFRVLLVGDVRHDSGVPRLARELGLASHVLFAGFQPDVTPMLARSQIFALTSLVEGCPNAVLEAMRASLPVVASPWGDQGWLVEHERGGFILDPRKTGEMADALGALIVDEELRSQFGAWNLRTLQLMFDPSRVGEETVALARRMIGSGARH